MADCSHTIVIETNLAIISITKANNLNLNYIQLKKVEEKVKELRHRLELDKHKAYEEAEELYGLAKEKGDRKLMADTLVVQSLYHQIIGDYFPSLEKLEQALITYIELGEKLAHAECLNMLGAVYNFLGDHETRLGVNLKCYELRMQAGDVEAAIGSLNNIGDTYLKLGDFKKASEYFLHGLKTSGINKKQETILHHNIGELYFMQNEYDKAISYFNTALNMSVDVGYKQIECASNKFLAICYLNLGESDKGYKHLIEASKIGLRNDFQEILADVFKQLSQYHESNNDLHEALGYYKKYADIKDKLFEESKLNKIQNLLFRINQNE